ncbi:MAG: hypothetical protein V7603_4299 [Micromonosporaceae bacterium]
MAKRWRVLALVEAPVLVLVGVLAVALWPDTAPHPERVSVRVAGCDVHGAGAANVTYTVVNGDRDTHAYRVELTVATSSTALGSGVGLVNRVAPGATVTGRALIPLRGNPTGATCAVRATAHDGHAGHHN